MDFDDLLVHVVTLLSEHPEVRTELDARYRYIMVDEYQDTNLAQQRFAPAVGRSSEPGRDGDRTSRSTAGGANLSNILNFSATIPTCKWCGWSRIIAARSGSSASRPN